MGVRAAMTTTRSRLFIAVNGTTSLRAIIFCACAPALVVVLWFTMFLLLLSMVVVVTVMAALMATNASVSGTLFLGRCQTRWFMAWFPVVCVLVDAVRRVTTVFRLPMREMPFARRRILAFALLEGGRSIVALHVACAVGVVVVVVVVGAVVLGAISLAAGLAQACRAIDILASGFALARMANAHVLWVRSNAAVLAMMVLKRSVPYGWRNVSPLSLPSSLSE
jgi:hypothetical protein